MWPPGPRDVAKEGGFGLAGQSQVDVDLPADLVASVVQLNALVFFSCKLDQEDLIRSHVGQRRRRSDAWAGRGLACRRIHFGFLRRNSGASGVVCNNILSLAFILSMSSEPCGEHI